jgi:hypothetical protein
VAPTRTEALPPVELWTTTSLLIVALLTFFFPLLTIQIPLMGTRNVHLPPDKMTAPAAAVRNRVVTSAEAVWPLPPYLDGGR